MIDSEGSKTELAKLKNLLVGTEDVWGSLDRRIKSLGGRKDIVDRAQEINQLYASNKQQFLDKLGLVTKVSSNENKLADATARQEAARKNPPTSSSLAEKIPSNDPRTAFNSAMSNLKSTAADLGLTVGYVNNKMAIVNEKGQPMRAPAGMQDLVTKANEANEKMRNTAVAMK